MLALKDRILLAEDDFLSALSGGEDAVVAFNERWEALVGEADQVLESTGLDKETSELLHTVAFRIATLADISAEIFESSDSITSDLLSQIENLVSQMTLDDRPSTSSLSCNGCPPSPRSPTPSDAAYGTTSEHQSRRKRRRVSDVMSPQAKRKRMPPPNVSSQSSQCHSADVPIRKRKRCTSEVDNPAPLCPAKRLYAGPRLHAVSDSFPTLWSTSSNSTSRSPSPDTCLNASALLDVCPLASPSTQRESEPNDPADVFDATNCFSPPLEPNSLEDRFLSSLLQFTVSPSFDFSAGFTESQYPPSCHSPSSSSISSQSSLAPSPLATPPSSPQLDTLAFDLSVNRCQPSVSLHHADCWLRCHTSHFDDPSTFLPSDFGSEDGWKTLLELDPSVWLVPPSNFPVEPFEVTVGPRDLLQPAMVSPA